MYEVISYSQAEFGGADPSKVECQTGRTVVRRLQLQLGSWSAAGLSLSVMCARRDWRGPAEHHRQRLPFALTLASPQTLLPLHSPSLAPGKNEGPGMVNAE